MSHVSGDIANDTSYMIICDLQRTC